MNARMYDPVTARFLQEDTYSGDPNDPLSLNLYTYCHNEPIMYWDPTGHSPILGDLATKFSIWLAQKFTGSNSSSNNNVSLNLGAYIDSKVTTQNADAYRMSGEEEKNIFTKWEKVEPIVSNYPAVITEIQTKKNQDVYKGNVTFDSVKENVAVGSSIYLYRMYMGFGNTIQHPEQLLYSAGALLDSQKMTMDIGMAVASRYQQYNSTDDINTKIMLGTEDTATIATILATTDMPGNTALLKTLVAAGKADASLYLKSMWAKAIEKSPLTVDEWKYVLTNKNGGAFTGRGPFGKDGNALANTQIKQIEILRNGGEVKVKTYEEARKLLDNMPELIPATEDRKLPNPNGKMSDGFADPNGTYRGDLINKSDPTAPVHPGVSNELHKNYPHYNIKLPDGNKAAIIIMGDDLK